MQELNLSEIEMVSGGGMLEEAAAVLADFGGWVKDVFTKDAPSNAGSTLTAGVRG